MDVRKLTDDLENSLVAGGMDKLIVKIVLDACESEATVEGIINSIKDELDKRETSEKLDKRWDKKYAYISENMEYFNTWMENSSNVNKLNHWLSVKRSISATLSAPVEIRLTKDFSKELTNKYPSSETIEKESKEIRDRINLLVNSIREINKTDDLKLSTPSSGATKKNDAKLYLSDLLKTYYGTLSKNWNALRDNQKLEPLDKAKNNMLAAENELKQALRILAFESESFEDNKSRLAKAFSPKSNSSNEFKSNTAKACSRLLSECFNQEYHYSDYLHEKGDTVSVRRKQEQNELLREQEKKQKEIEKELEEDAKKLEKKENEIGIKTKELEEETKKLEEKAKELEKKQKELEKRQRVLEKQVQQVQTEEAKRLETQSLRDRLIGLVDSLGKIQANQPQLCQYDNTAGYALVVQSRVDLGYTRPGLEAGLNRVRIALEKLACALEKNAKIKEQKRLDGLTLQELKSVFSELENVERFNTNKKALQELFTFLDTSEESVKLAARVIAETKAHDVEYKEKTKNEWSNNIDRILTTIDKEVMSKVSANNKNDLEKLRTEIDSYKNAFDSDDIDVRQDFNECIKELNKISTQVGISFSEVTVYDLAEIAKLDEKTKQAREQKQNEQKEVVYPSVPTERPVANISMFSQEKQKKPEDKDQKTPVSTTRQKIAGTG